MTAYCAPEVILGELLVPVVASYGITMGSESTVPKLVVNRKR
jgi:hypothetical protein